MKNTKELETILGKTHPSSIDDFLESNSDSFLEEEKAFSNYMRSRIKEKNLLQQDVFLQADIPERYGYKLLSEEKHTRQRDVILRLCYAAQLNREETQEALKIYGMPELYAKIPRDAVLMICFSNRPGSILDVNALLKEKNMETLRASGVQE